jgi:uncharacterized membrane protein YhhN
VVTLYRPDDNNILFLLSKPLLMFSLLAYFLHRVGALQLRLKGMFAAALFFSLVGDVFLMFEEEHYFLFGIAAFLLAQLCYVFFFFTHSSKLNWRSVLLALFPIAFGFWFLNNMLNVPEDMILLVNVYGAALGAMVLAAFNYGATLGRRALFINLGALSFLISDMLVAYNQFGEGNKYISIMVMITYAIAQFLLATSVIGKAEQDYRVA